MAIETLTPDRKKRIEDFNAILDGQTAATPPADPILGPAAPGTTTVRIDDGSVTVPNDKVVNTFRSLGPGPTDEQYLASLGPAVGAPLADARAPASGTAPRQTYATESAAREARMNQPTGFNTTRGGISARDAMGLTQGDRRNILRAQGVRGSGQIAMSKVMGAENNMRGQINDLRMDAATRDAANDALRMDLMQQRNQMAQEQTLLGQQAAAAEAQSTQATAAAMADALRADLNPERPDPYTTAAINLLDQGNLEGAQTIMAQRPELPGEIAGVDIDGDGTPDAIQQGGMYKGMLPRRNEPEPPARQRQEQALIKAMKGGDWAMAARLMGRIEEPGRSIASPNISRAATVADAQAYAQELGLGQAPEGAEQTASESAGQTSAQPVRMRHPNGTLRDVPAGQVDAAMKAGYSKL